MSYKIQIVVSILIILMSAVGATLGTYMLRSGSSERKTIVVGILIISMSAIGAALGTYMFGSGLSERKTIIEHKERVQILRPDIIIHLYPRPSEMLKLTTKIPCVNIFS